MIVLDTTVLLYAVSAEHPFRDPCLDLVDAIGDGVVRATTTVEVIQEFAHVRARRRSVYDAVAIAQRYAELLSPLLVVTADDLAGGLRLFERVESLGPFDAVLAATAKGRGAAAIVSADRAFAALDHVRVVVPDDAGIAELIADRP